MLGTTYCDGSEFKIWIAPNERFSLYFGKEGVKGMRKCTTVHENVHKADELKDNPNICKNVSGKMTIGAAHGGTARALYQSEIAAYTAEKNCLKNEIKNTTCEACKLSYEQRIHEIEGEKIPYYENFLKLMDAKK
jgi:hypothetical protein